MFAGAVVMVSWHSIAAASCDDHCRRAWRTINRLIKPSTTTCCDAIMHLNLMVLLVQLVWLLLEVLLWVLVKLLRGGTIATLLVI